jgi:hypothetical protein
MALKIKINGVDRTSLIEWDSFELVQVLTKEVDTFSFRLKKYAGQTYSPDLTNEVVIYDGDTKIYGGIIVELTETSEGLLREIEVTCKDYSHLLDKKLVVESYEAGRTTNLYAGDIVKDIISKYTTGFTTNNVSTGPTIESIKFNYSPVTKAIQEICDQIGYDWYVDENKDIHFFSEEQNLAPFELNDTEGNFVWNSLVIKKDISQLRNAIYVRGGDYTETITPENGEKYVADGQQRFFPISNAFNPDVNFKVEKSTDSGSTWVDLVEGRYGVDSPNDYDVLYDPNKKFVVFREDNKPANGNIIRVSGKFTLPIIVYVRDEDSIAKYGEYQYREVDKSIKSKEEAKQRAKRILADYAENTTEAQFTTYKNGLKVGQKIRVNSEIRGIDEWFTINKILTKVRSAETGEREYQVYMLASETKGIIDVLTKLLVTDPNKNIEILTGEILDKYTAWKEYFSFADLTPVDHDRTSGPWYVADSNLPIGKVDFSQCS